MLINSVFPVQNIQNDNSIIIHILSPNVVLDLFINLSYWEHYKFWTSICYLWPVGLIDLSSYNSFLSKKASCMDYFDYNTYSDETLCYLSQTTSLSVSWPLSSPLSWSNIISRASHTVYRLVIVQPQNELWARPQKRFIYQSCKNCSMYYWNNVAIVCENANRCGSREGKIILAKDSRGGEMEAKKGSEVCVCAQTHMCMGSGRGSVSIWWMGMCLN